jgi:hypothetical protein
MKLILIMLATALVATAADTKTPELKPEDKTAILQLQRDIKALEVQWLQAQAQVRQIQQTVEPLAKQLQDKLTAVAKDGYDFDADALTYKPKAAPPKPEAAKK